MWALGPYWHRCERLASGGPMWALGPQGTHSCKRPSSFRVLKRWAFGTWEKHCSRHEIWCWRCSLFWGPFAHIFVWQTQPSIILNQLFCYFLSIFQISCLKPLFLHEYCFHCFFSSKQRFCSGELKSLYFEADPFRSLYLISASI